VLVSVCVIEGLCCRGCRHHSAGAATHLAGREAETLPGSTARRSECSVYRMPTSESDISKRQWTRSFAGSRATPRPTPFVPPVTIAALPSNLNAERTAAAVRGIGKMVTRRGLRQIFSGASSEVDLASQMFASWNRVPLFCVRVYIRRLSGP
jgi:hypothetical protein